MNALLRRQIRKYLPKKLQSDNDVKIFLEAIDKSYKNSDIQFAMLQRATRISSKELFESNKQLTEESNSQKEIITKLRNVVNTLKFYDLKEVVNVEDSDSMILLDLLERQTKEIIEINKQKDKLFENIERQNLELNEYAHMVSHDLKSPLQSIDALTNWIENDFKDILGSNGKEILHLIRKNVEKMDTLLKGFVEYSAIDKINKHEYPVDLNKLVRGVLPSIHNPNQVQLHISEPLPIIQGDFYSLELLFYNLLDNAIKFNDKAQKGVVKIHCTDQNDFFKFSIEDNGVGIEEKYHDKIFLAFQKLENNYHSSGIGLSMVKKIITAYDGRVWLESTPNKGTIFHFTLKK